MIWYCMHSSCKQGNKYTCDWHAQNIMKIQSCYYSAYICTYCAKTVNLTQPPVEDVHWIFPSSFVYGYTLEQKECLFWGCLTEVPLDRHVPIFACKFLPLYQKKWKVLVACMGNKLQCCFSVCPLSYCFFSFGASTKACSYPNRKPVSPGLSCRTVITGVIGSKKEGSPSQKVP